MADPPGEETVRRAAAAGLKRWLNRARERVMAPFRLFKAQPDPTAIAATVPAWQSEVDRIVAELTPALQAGWAAAHLPGNYDPQDPYIQANLAMTRNLLVRIPDEVHAKVVAQILEGVNAGETTDQVAERVDNVLSYTGSENWPGRAALIARTETHKHFNCSMTAHALLRLKQDGGQWTKQWDTRLDGREREAHKHADGQVQMLQHPYLVGGEQLMYPGDPVSSPHNGIACRCAQQFEKIG